jgi:hypothetical protein
VTTVLLAAILALAPQAASTRLPETPQGKHVQAWVTAFNTGDEKTFLTAQRAHMAKSVLDKRPEAEHAKMFQRLRGDFGVMKIEKVVKATADEILFTVRTGDGALGTFTVKFEAPAPYLIDSIGDRREGRVTRQNRALGLATRAIRDARDHRRTGEKHILVSS